MSELVVYVHGIGRHMAGYSLAWWNALKPYLSRPIDHEEVLWSPVVNSPTLRVAPRMWSPEEQGLATELEIILEKRQRDLLPAALPGGPGAAIMPVASVRGVNFILDDFVRYMLNPTEREAILAIFDHKVRPLLQRGAIVHIISHSWGTVVAWEGMRRLDLAPLSGHVANLFVVGSALSIPPVQSNLFGRITDGRRPTRVDRVFNLDACGDIVGDPIGRQFSVTKEFLDLDAPGCSLLDEVCTHHSYFQASNLPVNRDIFASLISL